MIGDAGVANGAEEDCVERPQLLKAIVRHHLTGLYISLAAPVEGTTLQAKPEPLPGRFEHANAFGNHFFPDAVSSDDRDVEGFHQFFFILVTQIAAVTARTYREPPPTLL